MAMAADNFKEGGVVFLAVSALLFISMPRLRQQKKKKRGFVWWSLACLVSGGPCFRGGGLRMRCLADSGCSPSTSFFGGGPRSVACRFT
jgi:hypothetical protein